MQIQDKKTTPLSLDSGWTTQGPTKTTRRVFLQTAGCVAASATLTAAIPRVHAAENNTIKVALVGCGGRGTGAAANALSTTAGPVKLVAVADVFADHVETSLRNLEKECGNAALVSTENRFVGFDAYRRAIEAVGPGGVVLLATPPAFRPVHAEYAVENGCHVFMEKSFAVDAPGVRRILKAGETAKRTNLKIAGGLMMRHSAPQEEAIQRIHDGTIGEIITAWAYRMHGPVGFIARQPGTTELAHQIKNYSCFTWLNGSFLLDWMIHNIDVCCWAKNAWPVSVQGQGGRQVRSAPDQLFDHYSVEYTFPDGTRLSAQGRHMADCWDFFGDVIHGTKGTAVLGEHVNTPRIYKGHRRTNKDVLWQYKGPACNHYQREHDLFFDAIRNDKPYNEAERCAKACLTGIMGRMAVESGKQITWDEAIESSLELTPGLEKIASLDATPPVAPDAAGHYPLAAPGVTKAL